MHKRLLPVLILLISGNAHSQLLVKNNINWQQYLSNLMGGECVAISNVSYQGPPQAFSYFEDSAVSFGISRGIVISTGIANTDLSYPAGFFASTNLNMPGDIDLTNSLQQTSGTSYVTYDAVKIEFDFSSPVLDTVFVNYVFASEEYPEYVCTSFNDIFAFYVTDPTNSTTQNIATIPGTNYPVSINNINNLPCTLAPQLYIDGTNSTLHCFDGYTVPLTASFIAQPGITYHLKIVIADAGDGVFDSGVFLQIQDGMQNVAGHAKFQGNSALGGEVELFGYNLDSTQANPAGTATIGSNGNFIFNGVPFATYIVKITLDTLLHPGAVPTYYDSVFLWNDATAINLSCDSLAYGFNALKLLPTTGNGTISGTLFSSYGTFKTDTADGYATNVSVWLADAASKIPVAHTRTNNAGQYQFNQVPDGVYKLYVDLPVLPMDSVREVLIANGALTHTAQDYLVTPNSIKVYKAEEVSVGLPGQNPVALIYPNPAKNGLNITANSIIERAELFSVSGQLLSTYQINQNTFSIPTLGLMDGLYFITMSGAQFQSIHKFSVSK
ncbi:MAG: choice-of-anchor L domain-containing protein [Chitinophagales bacterium]|nr:choice-of-anchor L domain-containing protein [Chitinophagales bacterium]